jgi:hypothetical protein
MMAETPKLIRYCQLQRARFIQEVRCSLRRRRRNDEAPKQKEMLVGTICQGDEMAAPVCDCTKVTVIRS